MEWEKDESGGMMRKKKKEVVEWEKDESGGMIRKKKKEGIRLPDNFDLDMERKGMYKNNSNRIMNNFETHKETLFPDKQSMKNEGWNWLASFMKTRCVPCIDEDGRLNHKGGMRGL